MTSIRLMVDKLRSGNVPFLRELYGEDSEVLKQQYVDYLNLIGEFQELYPHETAGLFSSPGRTEIGGNHTDHNHGRVLAGAVNLDNIAIAAVNHSNLIQIKSAGYPQFSVDLTSLEVNPDEQFTSAALVRGICARLKQLGYQIGGFDACITGRVPKGSGLSSSASFEVLIGAIVSELFNDGKLDAVENAIVGQYAENHYFGKPCGLMDQTACSVGGLISIDFKEPANPVVQKVDFNFIDTGYALVITDTGGSHADLNDEYASLPIEMKSVASQLGSNFLREVSLDDIVTAIPQIREKVGDRALLRSYHFQQDNQRVSEQVKALESDNFDLFLQMVIESGYSSFMYNQNIYPVSNVAEQGLSLGLALSEMVLKGRGAWRVHGGGFAGTIQAFVPADLLNKYVTTLEHVFGSGTCHKLFIRSKGTCRIEI
ncbi:galactokinase [Alkaliflexus imshenetskii]|uniref:galactokinase n=1 Tax=Alkaliflexus imshenetskii TaxID=286730 RepID=UPI00047D567C|nr:galactokinase family protein [Alkaliflexus imshenetskii]